VFYRESIHAQEPPYVRARHELSRLQMEYSGPSFMDIKYRIIELLMAVNCTVITHICASTLFTLLPGACEVDAFCVYKLCNHILWSFLLHKRQLLLFGWNCGLLEHMMSLPAHPRK
jgi:hypothetical protein